MLRKSQAIFKTTKRLQFNFKIHRINIALYKVYLKKEKKSMMETFGIF